jgi:hypothetical protein
MLNLDRIIDGFALIEVHDVRVTRINVPFTVYDTLLKDDRFDLHDCRTYHQGTNRPVGNLWGASLHVGGTRTVVYPEGWFEGQRWGNAFKGNVVKPMALSEWGIHEVNNMIGLGLTIIVKTHSNPIFNICGPEGIAIETLREQITEEEWRRYIKNGFLSVKGASGKIYQLPRGAGYSPHVKVWENGALVAEICAYITDDSIPPTDRVLAFKAMIEADEGELWRRGNVFNMKPAVAA